MEPYYLKYTLFHPVMNERIKKSQRMLRISACTLLQNTEVTVTHPVSFVVTTYLELYFCNTVKQSMAPAPPPSALAGTPQAAPNGCSGGKQGGAEQRVQGQLGSTFRFVGEASVDKQNHSVQVDVVLLTFRSVVVSFAVFHSCGLRL